MMNDDLKKGIVQRMLNAGAVGVLTGAGISAASGIPTFRGKNGLWKNYRPEQLATPQAFRNNPKLVWEWYIWRRNLIRAAQPNSGHYALAELENLVGKFSLITQNVDDLHRRAGSRNITELHGNIMQSKCIDCGTVYPHDILLVEELPRCSECSGLIRPDVVWFGEALPLPAIQKAQEIARTCNFFMVVGTSGVVEPAASLPRQAKIHGAFLVEINMEETPLTSYCDRSIMGECDRILSELIDQLRDQKIKNQ